MGVNLSIDFGWFSDPRREALISLVGKAEVADGVMAAVWTAAQKHWKYCRKVPSTEFKKIEYSESVISAGLAREDSDGVYVNGSRRIHSLLIEDMAKELEDLRNEFLIINPKDEQQYFRFIP